MSAEEVAKAFVQHFYAVFDSNPEQLSSLYVSSYYFYLKYRWIVGCPVCGENS